MRLRLGFIYFSALFWLSAPLGACAAKHVAAPPSAVDVYGNLPASGTVALRSGLAWMPEDTPLFAHLAASLEPMLVSHGLRPVAVPPSRPAPLPWAVTSEGGSLGGAGQAAKSGQAGDAKAAEERSRELAAKGGLAQARLGKYPAADAALPPVAPAANEGDIYSVLFAQSQVRGMPVVLRGGNLPGRIPAEMASDDPQKADYALVCRFAAVRPERGTHRLSAFDAPVFEASAFDARLAVSPARTQPFHSEQAILVAMNGDLGSLITAAAPVRGVGTMGYGSPAPASPPRSSYGNTPGDYRRGYEGLSPVPGDPWNREADFKARNYPQRQGPPPEYAAPPTVRGVPPSPAPAPSMPKPPLPGDDDAPAGAEPAVPGTGSAPERGRSGASGYALEMELYSLAPVREGKAPALIWRAVVHQRADAPDLGTALPGMAALALQQGARR